MYAAAAMAQGRNRRNSFEYGMGPMGGPSALQMIQGAGLAGDPATAAAGQGSLFSPPNNMMGGGMPGAGGVMAGGMGMNGQQGGMQRQVLVTGLPPGLTDGDLRALFEICGPLRSVNKQPDQVSPA
jgi:hypothetical protein